MSLRKIKTWRSRSISWRKSEEASRRKNWRNQIEIWLRYWKELFDERFKLEMVKKYERTRIFQIQSSKENHNIEKIQLQKYQKSQSKTEKYRKPSPEGSANQMVITFFEYKTVQILFLFKLNYLLFNKTFYDNNNNDYLLYLFISNELKNLETTKCITDVQSYNHLFLRIDVFYFLHPHSAITGIVLSLSPTQYFLTIHEIGWQV